MFNKDDKSVFIKSNNRSLMIVSIFFLLLLSFATFSYLKNNTNILSSSSLPVFKQAVLGVSEVIDDSVNEKTYYQEDLQNSMKVLITEPSIQSKSSYTEAIARELDDKSGFKGRIAVVNQDDTFSKN